MDSQHDQLPGHATQGQDACTIFEKSTAAGLIGGAIGWAASTLLLILGVEMWGWWPSLRYAAGMTMAGFLLGVFPLLDEFRDWRSRTASAASQDGAQ